LTNIAEVEKLSIFSHSCEKKVGFETNCKISGSSYVSENKKMSENMAFIQLTLVKNSFYSD